MNTTPPRKYRTHQTMARYLLPLFASAMIASSALAKNPTTGPVIPNFGPVFDSPENSYNLRSDENYKVSMDVSATASSPDRLNRRLESVARFLNMQAQSGQQPEAIEMTVVVHGPAMQDLLTDDTYKDIHEVPNPNTALLGELESAGVRILLCSQSAAARGFDASQFNPAVAMARSAMTAHVRLQSEGYTLIPF